MKIVWWAFLYICNNLTSLKTIWQVAFRTSYKSQGVIRKQLFNVSLRTIVRKRIPGYMVSIFLVSHTRVSTCNLHAGVPAALSITLFCHFYSIGELINSAVLSAAMIRCSAALLDQTKQSIVDNNRLTQKDTETLLWSFYGAQTVRKF